MADGSAGIMVRPTVLKDAVAVEHVLRASYSVLLAGAYPGELIGRVLPHMTRANPQLLGSGTYYLAEIGGIPVGCGGWTPEKPGSTEVVVGIGHIRHFATDPRWVRCGIGRRLYDRCEVDARRAGMLILECYSTLNGEAFYATLGFRRIGRLRVPMGGSAFAATHMAKSIALVGG